MKKILVFLLPFLPLISRAQVSPVFYPSNYIRVVQPDVDDTSDIPPYNHNDLVSYANKKVKYDTLLNPFTGGLNNATFFNIDFNGDGIQDLYVFDRELGENQFFLFQGLSNKSTSYRYAPQYHYQFPQDVNRWAELADYNNDGLPDLFTADPRQRFNTCIKAYKNTSYRDQTSGNYINQFTVAADPLYYITDTGTRQEIDVSTASNPQFVDIDKDGHLDILAWDIYLVSPRFYRNRGLGTDSLSFWYTKECWGYFTEFIQHLYTPWDCEHDSHGNPVNYTGRYDPDPAYKSSAAHFYNSMCAFDVDCDGDIDLLLGDGLNDSLAFLENGNINGNHSYHKDTMINISYNHNNDYFPVQVPSVINSMPTASWLDINHDTLNDLIVASGQPTSFNDSYVVNRIHNIWYYNNEGSKASSPGGASNVFNLSTKDFLQNTMVDWGINSAPCFIDVDKDGRKDLIVAVEDGGAKNGFSHLVLYLNKPGKTPGSKPYLLFNTDDYLGFSKLQKDIYVPIPAAYLNTKDGKTDLLIGNASGGVMYYKDRSTGSNPADFQLSTSTLQYVSHRTGKLLPINVGGTNSAPTAADINGDGKTDLIIGSNYGNISYYRCIGYLPGSDNVPYFDSVTNVLGGIDTVSGGEHQTTPCVADMDKDGKLDMLLGDEAGNLWYFHDFDTIQPLIEKNKIMIWDNGANAVDSNRNLSTYIVPAVADLDQDGYPDIMLGCIRGGLIFLASSNNGYENLRNSTIDETAPYNPMGMSLFPNPARDMVTLGYNNLEKQNNVMLIVTDMLGRQVISNQFLMQNGKGDEQFSTNGLAAGIYIVNVVSGGQLLFSNKLVIDK